MPPTLRIIFKAVFLKARSLEQQPQQHLGSCWKRKSGLDVLNENPWGDGQWHRQSRWFWWSLSTTDLKSETEEVWLCTADTLTWKCHLLLCVDISIQTPLSRGHLTPSSPKPKKVSLRESVGTSPSLCVHASPLSSDPLWLEWWTLGKLPVTGKPTHSQHLSFTPQPQQEPVGREMTVFS